MAGFVNQNSRFDLGARKLFFVPAPKIVLQQYRPEPEEPPQEVSTQTPTAAFSGPGRLKVGIQRTEARSADVSVQFPAIEPYESGLFGVGDGHEIYWESCGNPAGTAALFLHGGPGSGCSAGQRRFFDPSLYRAVLFDQRGSGRSRPLASSPDAYLSTNTTAHLIADIEMLRVMLGVDRWTVLGLS
jgi:alpha/beta hydrolase fold